MSKVTRDRVYRVLWPKKVIINGIKNNEGYNTNTNFALPHWSRKCKPQPKQSETTRWTTFCPVSIVQYRIISTQSIEACCLLEVHVHCPSALRLECCAEAVFYSNQLVTLVVPKHSDHNATQQCRATTITTTRAIQALPLTATPARAEAANPDFDMVR